MSTLQASPCRAPSCHCPLQARGYGWKQAQQINCWPFLLVALLASGCATRQGSKGMADRSTPPIVVAVLDFRNDAVDPELDYLAQAISERITTHLGMSKDLTIVERAALQQAIQTLKLNTTGMVVNDGMAALVGSAVGADVVVTGSFVKIGTFTPVGNPIVVSIRLIDVPSQRSIPFQQVRATPGVELFDLIDQTAVRLLKHIVP